MLLLDRSSRVIVVFFFRYYSSAMLRHSVWTKTFEEASLEHFVILWTYTRNSIITSGSLFLFLFCYAYFVTSPQKLSLNADNWKLDWDAGAWFSQASHQNSELRLGWNENKTVSDENTSIFWKFNIMLKLWKEFLYFVIFQEMWWLCWFYCLGRRSSIWMVRKHKRGISDAEKIFFGMWPKHKGF